MSNQLELVPKPPKPLTDRQQRALDHITANQPVPTDELGALLHTHGLDSRCAWCRSTGTEVGKALSRRGLVRRTRPGWVLKNYRGGDQRRSSLQSDIPF